MTEQLRTFDELWDSSVELQLVDESAASEVDGEHILARVRGPAFFPNIISGNNVLYPREAWENAINDPVFLRKLKDRLIYGTIGHNIRLDDDAIRNGAFSHIVTEIGIDESDVGYAEYLVLNTPSGRILNTILRAKSKIRVSTKARGLFKDTKNGIKTINPDAFKLERIDFVLDPGYLQANPDLLESFNEIKGEKDSMSLDDKSSDSLDNTENLSESLDLLRQYQELGTPSEISEAMEKAADSIHYFKNLLDEQITPVTESIIMERTITEELAAYRKLGTPEELNKIVESADKLINYVYSGKVKFLAKRYNVQESIINKMVSSGTDLSVVEELLNNAAAQDNDDYVLDDEGNPVLDADGNPILKTREETSESRRTSRRDKDSNLHEAIRVIPGSYKLISEEDGTEYEVDDEGNPILDDEGNPVPKKKMEESRTIRVSNKYKLVSEEDGTEYLTDEDGNPILDSDGNPVPKENKEKTEESIKPKLTGFKLVSESGVEYQLNESGAPVLDQEGNLVPRTKIEESSRPSSRARTLMRKINEEDGVEYQLDADGNPVLDKDGNPIPVEKTEESRRHTPSTSRFSSVNESRKVPATPPPGLINKLFSGSRTRR